MKARSLFPLFPLLAALATACTAPIAEERASMAAYTGALAATDSKSTELLRDGSDEERQAIRRFKDFYVVYSAEVIREKVREVYAKDAFFRDPFREVQGIEAIEEYFVRAAEAADYVRFDIQQGAEKDDDYYFRWVMKYQAKREESEPPNEAVGMSHVRFDRSGKVIFQNDYWDPARGVYEKVPILGWIVYKIRSRF